MFARVNRHLSVFLAAVLGVIVGSVGPGVARAAYDAVNADKVDGFHAVGSGATANNRAGKLVAANTKGRAPDAERLNGYPHGKLRFLSLPIQAVAVDSADKYSDGVVFGLTGSPQLNISFLVPPDHDPADPLLMDILFHESTDEACGIRFYTGGLSGPTNGMFFNGGWEVLPGDDNERTVTLPAGAGEGHRQTFSWPYDDKPGQVVGFRLTRFADHAGDTCNYVTVHGLQLRY